MDRLNFGAWIAPSIFLLALLGCEGQSPLSFHSDPLRNYPVANEANQPFHATNAVAPSPTPAAVADLPPQPQPPTVTYVDLPTNVIPAKGSVKFQIQVADSNSGTPELIKQALTGLPSSKDPMVVDSGDAVDCEDSPSQIAPNLWQFDCAFTPAKIKGAAAMTGLTLHTAFTTMATDDEAKVSSPLKTSSVLLIKFPKKAPTASQGDPK